MIHAVSLDLSFWEKQIQDLAEGRDVIAVDLPGHGQSASPPQDWSISGVFAGLVAALDEAEVNSAHLVGLSFGGMVAQEMAISHPDRVRSLTLLATAGTFPDEARAAMKQHAALAQSQGMGAITPFVPYWVANATSQNRPDIIDRVSRNLRRLNPAVYALIWRMIADFVVVQRLSAVSCPTLVLVGDSDMNTPEPYAVAQASAVQRGRFAVSPGAAHLIPLDLPSETAERRVSGRKTWLGSKPFRNRVIYFVRLLEHDSMSAIDRQFAEVLAVLSHRLCQPAAGRIADRIVGRMNEEHGQRKPAKIWRFCCIGNICLVVHVPSIGAGETRFREGCGELVEVIIRQQGFLLRCDRRTVGSAKPAT